MSKIARAESVEPKTSFREFISLLYLNLVVKFRNLKEFIKVAFFYYKKQRFRKIDFALRLNYLFKNPYSISKAFLVKRKEKDIYSYGETPLTTLDDIADEARITKQDTVFELGCGRGRGCFWLNSVLGCKVVGIDYVPDFISIAQSIKEKFDLNEIEFRLGDFLDADYAGATVIYLYGSCLIDPFVQRLVKRFEKLPQGTKIITVSYSLNDYSNSDKFEIMNRFTAKFTWGDADVYIHLVK